MAHEPNAGRQPVYAGPSASSAGRARAFPETPLKNSAEHPPSFLSRSAAKARRDAVRAPTALVYSPARAPPPGLANFPSDAPLGRRSRLELPPHAEGAVAWREIRAELRRVVGESTFDIWLAPLEMDWIDGRVVLLKAPPATQPWIAKRFGRLLESCARAVLGTETRVAFAGANDSPGAYGPQPGPHANGGGTAHADPTGGGELNPQLNPRYSFDQFIIGDSNHLAHAAALSVAELPGQAYNPLFLHAPPGLGKTHLLHAIGNYVLAFAGGATVRYATVETLTNHFVSALGSPSLDPFKKPYRNADVLLVHYVQFPAAKRRTEE